MDKLEAYKIIERIVWDNRGHLCLDEWGDMGMALAVLKPEEDLTKEFRLGLSMNPTESLVEFRGIAWFSSFRQHFCSLKNVIRIEMGSILWGQYIEKIDGGAPIRYKGIPVKSNSDLSPLSACFYCEN